MINLNSCRQNKNLDKVNKRELKQLELVRNLPFRLNILDIKVDLNYIGKKIFCLSENFPQCTPVFLCKIDSTAVFALKDIDSTLRTIVFINYSGLDSVSGDASAYKTAYYELGMNDTVQIFPLLNVKQPSFEIITNGYQTMIKEKKGRFSKNDNNLYVQYLIDDLLDKRNKGDAEESYTFDFYENVKVKKVTNLVCE